MIVFTFADVKGIKKKKLKVAEDTKGGKEIIRLIKTIYEAQEKLDILSPGIEIDKIRLAKIKYNDEKMTPKKFFNMELEDETGLDLAGITSKLGSALLKKAMESASIEGFFNNFDITTVSELSEKDKFRTREELKKDGEKYIFKSYGGRKVKPSKPSKELKTKKRKTKKK